MLSSAATPSSTLPPTYYVLWRTRPGHPWRGEELANHGDAQRRYSSLVELGYEAYLERR